ncbi:MAG: hypothetical protein NXI24_13115 [bacterium]|nr:hypothetical protein [bacterium]
MAKGKARSKKYRSASSYFRKFRREGRPVIVAEGDSWFDYPGKITRGRHPETDVLDFLALKHGFAVHRESIMGDTLENMVYNTLERQVIDAIEEYEPRYFLFSGGGNDLVGRRMLDFLVDAEFAREFPLESPPKSPFLEDAFRLFVNTVMKSAYRLMIRRVQSAKPDIKIYAHGYDYVLPSGKPVIDFGFVGFVGPWILPNFKKRKIKGKEIQEEIIRSMINIFNEMLEDLETEYKGLFYHVDCRGLIKRKEWANEIHPKKVGYIKIAAKIAEKMKQTA